MSGLETSERKIPEASPARPPRDLAGTSARSASSRAVGVPPVLRWLDLVALVIALPVFLVADLPLAGYLVGGLAWLAQRLVQLAVARRAEGAHDPRTI